MQLPLSYLPPRFVCLRANCPKSFQVLLFTKMKLSLVPFLLNVLALPSLTVFFIFLLSNFHLVVPGLVSKEHTGVLPFITTNNDSIATTCVHHPILMTFPGLGLALCGPFMLAVAIILSAAIFATGILIYLGISEWSTMHVEKMGDELNNANKMGIWTAVFRAEFANEGQSAPESEDSTPPRPGRRSRLADPSFSEIQTPETDKSVTAGARTKEQPTDVNLAQNKDDNAAKPPYITVSRPVDEKVATGSEQIDGQVSSSWTICNPVEGSSAGDTAKGPVSAVSRDEKCNGDESRDGECGDDDWKTVYCGDEGRSEAGTETVEER